VVCRFVFAFVVFILPQGSYKSGYILQFCFRKMAFLENFQFSMQKTGPKAGFSASIGVYMEKKFVFIG